MIQDQRVWKLARLLGDQDLAERLVRGGLTSPRRIKVASDDQIKAIPGIGQAALQRVRGRFGSIKG